MKGHRFVLLSALFLFFCLISLSPAQAQEWQIDKNHSNIYFQVRHTFVPVRGLFKDFSGTINFDAASQKMHSITFQVQVDSINTNITKRDNHLRSNDFFAARQFPQMSFTSSKITPLDNHRYRVQGQLTVRSVTKEVEIECRFLGMQDNPLKKGQKVAGFEAEFSINRLDYNVGTGQFAKMGVIGEDVHILVALELLADM